MAAPEAMDRGTPGGLLLQDGYQSLVTFKEDFEIKFWEKTITPPGLDGGDAIALTTMHNTAWRTFAARGLKTLTEMTLVCAYDPDVYTDGTEIAAAINRDDTITVTWHDGSQLAFFGFLQKFEPSDLTEGEQPEATITIVATNMDSDGAEQAPVMVSVGTPA